MRTNEQEALVAILGTTLLFSFGKVSVLHAQEQGRSQRHRKLLRCRSRKALFKDRCVDGRGLERYEEDV